MGRMEASFKNARALRLRFSQSLARRRQRLSHAKVRSTIQRLGNCTNYWITCTAFVAGSTTIQSGVLRNVGAKFDAVAMRTQIAF